MDSEIIALAVITAAIGIWALIEDDMLCVALAIIALGLLLFTGLYA